MVPSSDPAMLERRPYVHEPPGQVVKNSSVLAFEISQYTRILWDDITCVDDNAG
jgi:hypothetical protein